MERTAALRRDSQDELRRKPIRRSSHSGRSRKFRTAPARLVGAATEGWGGSEALCAGLEFCILHIIGNAGGRITLLAIRRGPLPGPRTGECELAYNDASKEEEVPTGHAKLDTLRPERVRTYPLQALRTCQRLIRRPTCPLRKTLQQTGARV
jgi:hypothetical protein